MTSEWVPIILTIAGMVFSITIPMISTRVRVMRAQLDLPPVSSVKSFHELCQTDWIAVRRAVIVDHMKRKIARLESTRRVTLIFAFILVASGIILGSLGMAGEESRLDISAWTAKELKTLGFTYLIGAAVALSSALYLYALLIERETTEIKGAYGPSPTAKEAK